MSGPERSAFSPDPSPFSGQGTLFSGQGGLFSEEGPRGDAPRELPPGEKAALERLRPKAGATKGVDEGRARAERALRRPDSRPTWLIVADSEARGFAARGEEFTTDDLWERLDAQGVKVPLEQRRQIGSVCRRLQKRGLIEAAGYRISERPANHGRGVRVWKPKVDRP